MNKILLTLFSLLLLSSENYSQMIKPIGLKQEWRKNIGDFRRMDYRLLPVAGGDFVLLYAHNGDDSRGKMLLTRYTTDTMRQIWQ
jgi:hypothetical protein